MDQREEIKNNALLAEILDRQVGDYERAGPVHLGLQDPEAHPYDPGQRQRPGYRGKAYEFSTRQSIGAALCSRTAAAPSLAQPV